MPRKKTRKMRAKELNRRITSKRKITTNLKMMPKVSLDNVNMTLLKYFRLSFSFDLKFNRAKLRSNVYLGDADMYDPEEACKEEELSMEVTNDEGDPSVISLDLKTSIKEDDGEEEEEVKQEKEVKVKEEPKTTSTPLRQTRTGVKNGAGPKSKKARKQ